MPCALAKFRSTSMPFERTFTLSTAEATVSSTSAYAGGAERDAMVSIIAISALVYPAGCESSFRQTAVGTATGAERRREKT